MSTRLLLLMAPPFLVCAVLVGVMIAARQISDRGYTRALEWSAHAAAILEVRADAEHVMAAAAIDGGELERAAAALARSSARSAMLARRFSDAEADEEAGLDRALDELVARARTAAEAHAPEQLEMLRAYFAHAVLPSMQRRVADETTGSHEAADRGRADAARVAVWSVALSLLPLALGLLLCVRVARQLTGSVAYLEAQARRIAGGDLAGPIALATGDELGRLAGALDEMAVQLRSSMVSRSELARLVEERTRELTGARDQLQQAQKMDAIGRLAGGVAHDFNNLLAVILSYAEMLIEELGPGHEARPDVVEIVQACHRAANLTRQLLAFSRKQARTPTDLRLDDVVANLHKMLLRIIGEDVVLSSQLGAKSATIYADVGQIEQVITNLVVNARDAMPSGGQLAISTKETTVTADAAGALGLDPGPHVLLTVADTGCGMDAATRDRIFEPFFTTKPVGKGTGLGLATVFGIIQQSGGAIAVESEPGKGTTFRVYFPRRDLASAPDVAPEVGEPVRGSSTVLVVEDDERLRSVVTRQLETRGYRVITAPQGDAALAVLRQRPHAVDVILTDLVMPGMTGLDLAREVRGRWPETKILFMSGYSDHPVLEHAQREAAGPPLIAKPFTIDVLAGAIQAALAS